MIMPTKASHADLELLEHMAETVESARDFNDALEVAVFINMAPTNTHAERQTAKQLLSEYPEFHLMRTVVAAEKHIVMLFIMHVVFMNGKTIKQSLRLVA
ncbi:hypothetical protein [Vibrio parahaemolyticus]